MRAVQVDLAHAGEGAELRLRGHRAREGDLQPLDGDLPEVLERVDDDAPEKHTQEYLVEVGGKRFDVKVVGEAPAYAAPSANGAGAGGGARKAKRGERKTGGAGGPDLLESPLQGNMWKVLVKQGDTVEEGQLLCIIEAMKMENEITAHKAGVVAELPISEGAAVSAGDTLAVIKSPE